MYTFKTEPWEHQLTALDFLMVRHSGALYTDMGTGKTKVGIDLIVNREFQTTLIVGTKKSCDVWEDEFRTHCGDSKLYVVRLDVHSTKDKVTVLEESITKVSREGLKSVFIINYDSIWRKPFSEKLLKVPIDCVICDESHRIKSPSSKCSMYLARLGKKVENRYIFTGTPSTESPVDVYAQYRFLDPSIFGTRFNVFRDHYENIDVTRTSFAGYRVLDKKQPYKNLEELREKVYSCAYYVESPLTLPDTVDVTVPFTPNSAVIKAYKDIDKEGVYEDEDGVIEINNALVKSLREQELLSGYLPLEQGFTEHVKKRIDTCRRDTLKAMLEEIPLGEKVVIFAKFRHDFDEIQSVCKDLKRSYGEISGVRNDYDKWKDGKINTVAVHYRSGAESISLVQARYCIYYSLSHSYGMYAQSRKRVHRPGQDRPVTYYHIVARIPRMTTVDEKIMLALAGKQDLADYLLKEEV